MHFEILVEDQSGHCALSILVPKIIGPAHTFKIHAYKGVGRIPGNMQNTHNASKRILLDNLPKLLRGYGRTYNTNTDFPVAVILVCDLDDRCKMAFRSELSAILHACSPQPVTRFCIAIEEGEAWLLGDLQAIRSAFPRAKVAILNSYVNDSICDTWERLADAVYPGGSHALSSKGWQIVGVEKSRWAEDITPFMDVENNNSPSFCHFRDKMRELIVSD